MRKAGLILTAVLLVVLAGCRGDAELVCESGGAYLSAVETTRVKAPEGLDDLDELKEVPLPDASPRAESAEGNGCLEAPPDIRGN